MVSISSLHVANQHKYLDALAARLSVKVSEAGGSVSTDSGQDVDFQVYEKYAKFVGQSSHLGSEPSTSF